MQAHNCRHAAFDGGPDDPRTLVYRYQQELRGHLLAKTAAERAGIRWWASRRPALGGVVRLAVARRPDLAAEAST